MPPISKSTTDSTEASQAASVSAPPIPDEEIPGLFYGAFPLPHIANW